MLIENMMYFALGALATALLTLIILPAVWKRAVRLTKRRIEAATPVRMAEFRADKDQLRAEFALSTRRLEMTIDTLRGRLAEQLGDVNQKRSDLAALLAERDKHISIVQEMESREADLRSRVIELEREGADLAQQLRHRERTAEVREAELAQLRDALNVMQPVEPPETAGEDSLESAEARFVEAQTRLNAILSEKQAGKSGQSLAQTLGDEADLEDLRIQVLAIETSILNAGVSQPLAEAKLRRQLVGIAAAASRVVRAPDKDQQADSKEPESLFDRVQRFADEAEPKIEEQVVRPTPKPRRKRPNAAPKRVKTAAAAEGR